MRECDPAASIAESGVSSVFQSTRPLRGATLYKWRSMSAAASGAANTGDAGKTNSETVRYDYFETDVNIGGKEYIVLFDVEVLPSTNNYRTHRLVDIAITPQGPSNQIHQAGLSSAGSADTLASVSNRTQGETAVNSESQGDDGLGAANAGFDPVSQWQESTDRYHPVNEAAAQTTLEERGRVPTDVPVTDVVGGQVSKHVSTLVNANITTNEMAAALMEDARKGAFSAQPYTDAEAAAKVREHIEQVGWDVAFGEYRADIMSGKASKDISMTGIVLYNNAVNSGALLDAMDVAALMASQSTRPLRGATLFRLWGGGRNRRREGSVYRETV